MDEIKVEEKQIVEQQTETPVQQSEPQAEQIVELPFHKAFKQKMEEGAKTVEEILYGDGEYFSL